MSEGEQWEYVPDNSDDFSSDSEFDRTNRPGLSQLLRTVLMASLLLGLILYSTCNASAFIKLNLKRLIPAL